MNSTLQYLDSSSGVVGPSGRDVRIYSITGSDGNGNATLEIYKGTSAVTENLLAVLIPTSVITAATIYGISYAFPGGVLIPGGCYITITGAINVSVQYSVEN